MSCDVGKATEGFEDELRQRIEYAVTGIDNQMLVRVWQELD